MPSPDRVARARRVYLSLAERERELKEEEREQAARSLRAAVLVLLLIAWGAYARRLISP